MTTATTTTSTTNGTTRNNFSINREALVNNQSTLIKAILINRGFNQSRVNGDNTSPEISKKWHELLVVLHNECYAVGAECYNNDGSANFGRIYESTRNIWNHIGIINGGKLRNDANTATVLIAKAVTHRNKKSTEMEYQYSRLRNDKKWLATLEETNGTSPESILIVKKNIEDIEAEIERLKKESGSICKEFGKVSFAAFCKSVEDYIADMIENRLVLTEEEVQAEIAKRNRLRNEKTAKRRAEKKAAQAKKQENEHFTESVPTPEKLERDTQTENTQTESQAQK